MPPTPAAHALEFVSEPLLGTYPMPQDMALSPYGSWYPVPEFLGEVPPQWQDYIARLEEERPGLGRVGFQGSTECLFSSKHFGGS